MGVPEGMLPDVDPHDGPPIIGCANQGSRVAARLSSTASSLAFALTNAIGAVFLLAGGVGFVWLLVKWQWRSILTGFALLVGLSMFWRILALPSLPVAVLGVHIAERRRSRVGLALVLMASLWQALATAACATVVYWCMIGPGPVTLWQDLPVVLWGYFVATATFAGMLDEESSGTTRNVVAVFEAQIVYAVWPVVHGLIGVPWNHLLFAVAIGVVFEATIVGLLLTYMWFPRGLTNRRDRLGTG